MSIKSTLHRLFNAPTPHEDAASGPTGDGSIRNPELGALDSFRLALTDAAEKFARKEIASLHRIKGWRWNLTGIELVVKSGNPQQIAELKRKPGKALVSVAKIAIDQSENFADMFITDHLHGVTVETEVDPEATDWVDVIGVYGNTTTPYTFVFMGELVDQSAPKTPSDKTSSKGTTTTPLLYAAEDDNHGTIQLTSESFWLEDLPHPYGTPHNIDIKLSDLPITFGRAPMGANPLPWGLKNGFVPLYGNAYISARHFTLSLDTDSQLCITDHSTNGTWLVDRSREDLATTPMQLQKDTACTLTYEEDRVLTYLYLTAAGDESWIAIHCINTRSQTQPSTHAGTHGKTETTLWPFDETKKETDLSGVSKAPIEPTFITSPETDLSGSSTTVPTPPVALAVLRVRLANGSETSHAIHSLPVDIGREGLGDIPSECNKVSRTHLRLQAMQGKNAVQVNHIAHNRNGTYNHGCHAQDELFVWPITHPNSRDDGWLILGEPRLSQASVQVRLEKSA